jgi:hypothetical protein
MKHEKPQVMTQPGICAKCGNSLRPGAQFCPACGSKVQVEAVGKSHKKLWKTLGTIGIIVGVIAVLVLIASVVLSSIGLAGPGTKTTVAAVRSVAAGSFSVEAEGSIGSADLEMSLDSELDLKQQTFASLGSITADCGRNSYDMDLGILNDESALVSADDNAIEDVLDYCAAEFSEREMERLGELLEDVFAGLEGNVNEEQLLRCTIGTLKLLNDKSWLKDHANYKLTREKGVKVHNYEVDLFEFAADVLENYAPAYDDPDLVEAACDALRDIGDEMDDCQVQLRVGIRRGRIDHIALEAEADFLPDIQLRFAFSEYGSCEVNTKQVRKVLEMG